MDGKLAEFATVTGCADADKARFFLESAAGDVAAAVEAFFEHGEGEGAPGSEDPAPGSGAPEGPGAAPVAAAAASPAARPTRSTRSTRAAGKGNVRGFGDLGKTSDGGGDDDDDEPTEWYTGGAASGSVVQDPTKRKNPVGADRMRAALDGAREHGAVDGTREDLETRTGAGVSGASSFGGAFVGSGRTLGSTAAEASVPSAAAAKETADAPSSAAEAPQTHVVTFWSNGFTVNDGPLRAYDDPRNTPFMEAVSKGQCPPELVPANPTTPININLVRKDADYEPPPEPKYVAFSGAGRTLAASAPTPAVSVPDAAVSTASGEWSCDETQPSASVQLRLRDGSRKVAKFNLTHTVRDVRAFIASAAPAAAGDGNYTLQLAGFPPERLDDEARAVGDGLAGAVIIQR